MYVCVCVCVSIYIYMYVCIYVCIYICIYMYVYMYIMCVCVGVILLMPLIFVAAKLRECWSDSKWSKIRMPGRRNRPTKKILIHQRWGLQRRIFRYLSQSELEHRWKKVWELGVAWIGSIELFIFPLRVPLLSFYKEVPKFVTP